MDSPNPLLEVLKLSAVVLNMVIVIYPQDLADEMEKSQHTVDALSLRGSKKMKIGGKWSG